MLVVCHHLMEIFSVTYSSSNPRNDSIWDTPFVLNLGTMEEGFCVQRQAIITYPRRFFVKRNKFQGECNYFYKMKFMNMEIATNFKAYIFRVTCS